MYSGIFLLKYKDSIEIPPIFSFVDDTLGVSLCGPDTVALNAYLNLKTGTKRTQYSTDKCIKIHVGSKSDEAYCQETYVDGWKLDTGTDRVSENYNGQIVMKERTERKYLGDIISGNGSNVRNINYKTGKGRGIVKEIMQDVQENSYGCYYFQAAILQT